jgi:ABC-type Mn2+/Zn2+ transport system ATPase subunit
VNERETPLPAGLASLERRNSARALSQTPHNCPLPHCRNGDHVAIELGGRRILDDISFWVPKGEFVCLCGPNGAGKSTLLKAIMGLIPCARGTIQIAGESVVAGHHKVGYVPQRKGFNRDFPARAIDLIVAASRGTWPGRIRPDEREHARKVLAKIGGERLIDRPLAALSGGETQRVFLARALINDPQLIVLDEPTAGVDARGRGELLELLTTLSRSDELAAILVTHNLAAVAQTAERIVYIEAGRVLCWGLPEELLGQQSLTALAAFQARDHHAHDPRAHPDDE